MRQVNRSGYTLRSPDYGGEIVPGEEVDHPKLITGCESLEPPPAEDKPADPAPEQKSVTRRKAATDAGEATP